MAAPVTNERIASLLERVADQLEAQHANPYRVDAYRAGASVVRDHPESVRDLALREGRKGLDALPRIGTSLAAAIDEIAHTGSLRLLDRLEGRGSPVDELTRVPGIGERLAERIHRELDVDTLEELEAAARDGRLAALAGFGGRRVEAIRAILETTLDRSSRRASRVARPAGGAHPSGPAPALPPVGTLLAVDREYRERAAAGELPRIAPVRNNPEGTTWLPLLHTEVGGWHFTAMFSNSDSAHELKRTDDWVVVYFERDGHENQCTVVTETRGLFAGRRVVRGQEDACAAYYRTHRAAE